MSVKNDSFRNLIFYEIYPTSFYDSNGDGIGDLKGIEEKLDYIKDTGFNGIWINPFYESPFMDGGYDVKDFYKVDPKFGTNDDFKSLCKTAKEKGIRIIIDLVPGHASETNAEFLKSAKQKKNDCSDLFIWNDSVWNNDPKYRLIAGRHERDAAYMVNFFSTQPAFNYGFNDVENPSWQMSYTDPRTFKARDYMVSVMKYWMSLGASGFRVDMADSLVKNDDKKDKKGTIVVWNYIFSKVREEYPNIYLVSESGIPRNSFRYGFDADFTLDFQDSYIRNLFRKYNGKTLLNDGEGFDEFLGRFKADYKTSEELGGYIANISGNHDEIRNRSMLKDEKRSKLFYLLIMSLPGTPFIYYGDEILMEQTPYEILPSKDGGYYRTGCRTPMQWDDSDNMGFSSKPKDELYLPVGLGNRNNVKDMLEDKNSFYYYLKDLISIRKSHKDLIADEMIIKTEGQLLIIERGELILYINFDDKDYNVDGKILISNNDNNKTLKKFEGCLVKAK